jgi:hypothetical protein
MGAVLLALSIVSVPDGCYWLDGTFADPAVMEIDRRHDPAFDPSGRIPRDGHQPGDQIQFWAMDYTDDPLFYFYLTPATCRYAGEDTYIFVEDAVWEEQYGPDDVLELAAALEDSTPSGSGGILDTVTGVFGPVPDEIDGDPRVYFLVLDIRDGFDPSQGGAYIAGFFSPYNQFTDEEAYLYYGGHSNEVEMLYIDCDPGDAEDASYTASHELVHLVSWGIEPFSGEDLWVSESQAQAGTYLCGYPASQVETFIEVGGVTPVEWTEYEDIVQVVAGYGAAFLFFSYLHQNWGGDQFLWESMRASGKGLEGVAEAIQDATGQAPDMLGILEDWLLATWIDDPAAGDGRWGWEGFRIADYDSPSSPGNRRGLDYRGVVGETPWQDPPHAMGAYTVQAYSLDQSLEGSFRASGQGIGDMEAFVIPEGTGMPERLPTGAGDDLAVQLPADGDIVLACPSFLGVTLDAYAGAASSAAGPSVYPQPCFGTLYFQFASDGAPVSLAVIDAAGALVEAVDYGAVPAGESVLSWPGASELSTGVYMYRFAQGGAAWTGRFAVVR